LTLRLFLVRHGETESNRQGLALGRADVPLNDLGRKQAGQLAAALADEPLLAIYASPLQRTIDTARAIATAHNLSVSIEPAFIEMDVGEVEGLTFSELRERYPQLLETWVSAQGPQSAMPGGERLLDVQQRATKAVQSLATRHPEGAVCVVTHNFVILSLLADALAIDLAGFRRLRHAVGAITTLELRPGRHVRVLRLNDTCHLTDQLTD
jgi:2,3-bisphosphoglycerate-dependent phosphoglycerate mutase